MYISQYVVSICFIGAAMGRQHRSCRRCTCHVTIQTSLNSYDESTAHYLTHKWVNPLFGNQDYEQFNLGPMPGATCTTDPNRSCDKWQAWFKGWRLCSNGPSYSCSSGSATNDPIYTIDCNQCEESVVCYGDCTLDCNNRP